MSDLTDLCVEEQGKPWFGHAALARERKRHINPVIADAKRDDTYEKHFLPNANYVLKVYGLLLESSAQEPGQKHPLLGFKGKDYKTELSFLFDLMTQFPADATQEEVTLLTAFYAQHMRYGPEKSNLALNGDVKHDIPLVTKVMRENPHPWLDTNDKASYAQLTDNFLKMQPACEELALGQYLENNR